MNFVFFRRLISVYSNDQMSGMKHKMLQHSSRTTRSIYPSIS